MNKDRKANYGFGEIILNCFSILYTRLFWKNARLIRLPMRIRGRKFIEYGVGFTTGYSCRIEMYGNGNESKLLIGDNCIIGDYAHISANYRVTIGKNVLMASRVFISDTNHGNYSGEYEVSSPQIAPNNRKLYFKETVIGDNVWIGENVSILPGVKVGYGCIIGANSVVTKSIPDNCIAVGNPARVIKKYDYLTETWVENTI